VVQEAFLSTYRAKDRFRGDVQPSTWLYRIVVNAALVKLQSERRPRQISAGPVEEVEIVDWSPGPEPQVLNTELKAKLEEVPGLLPGDLRTAVALRDVQQLSTQKATDVVGVSGARF